MIEVELPGGAIAEFPDGTPQEVIRGALQKRFGSPQQKPNAVSDVATSLGSGIARGTADLIGLPGTVQRGFDWVGDQVGKAVFGDSYQPVRIGPRAPTGADIKQAATDVTGITLPTPQTTAGKYAHTIGEFAPAAMGGPGGFFGKLLKFGAAPAVASEAAGQAFEGTDAEPWARAGAALATGGLAAMASRPSTPMQALREVAPQSMTQQDIAAASRLMQEGAQRGVQLTWPEALAQATGRRVDLTDVQRVLEQSPGGRPVMSEFMSKRPGQVQQAMGDELATMGPQGNPIRTGLDISRVSQQALDGLRNRINVITRPLYQAAGPVNVDPARFTALSKDPLFKAALRDIRNDPVYSRSVAGFPDMSVQVFDAIKKRLDDLAGSASASGKNYEASVTGGLARDLRDAATAASPEYSQALSRQAQFRQGVLEPAETGPLGQMAGTPDVGRQASILFPSQPVAGSERTVGQTVRMLVRRDPKAATQLVQSHLATAFDEAVQANVGGANQWGGAKAAATIIGNPQQERNLQAAIEALPAGQLRWRGMKALMEVLQATGQRQRPNSATEFNRQISQDMTRGGVVGTGVSLATSPSSALTYLRDSYQRFRLGQNTAELARIITAPGSEKLLARLVGAKTVSERQRAAAVLIYEGSNPILRDE